MAIIRRVGLKILGAAVILLAGAVIYGQTARAGWIWDDGLYITQNPALRTGSGLAGIWRAPPGINYFPLTETVQWLQWRLWGARAAGYHLTNAALHALGALLVWGLLRRLGLRLAWAGGLVFAVHPLAVESVAWASELKNALSLPLLLLAMIAYLEFDGRRSAWRGDRGPASTPWPQDRAEPARWGRWAPPYFLSLFLFVLALLAKSTVVMFPVAILLHAWWKRGRIAAADMRASLPFFAAAAALGLVAIAFEWGRAMGGAPAGPGGLARLGEAGRAAAFYAGKGLLPVGLRPIYPRWPAGAFWPDLAGWAVAAAITAALWRRRTAAGRAALFGWLFFLVNLAPVLGPVPMAYQRISWVADHFAYISLVGIAGLAAGGLEWIWRRERIVAGGVLALAALALAAESRAYAAFFRDEETLWTEALRRNPGAWLAHNNLGKVRLGQGRAAEAAGEFQAALAIEPDSAEAHANLGNAWQQQGRLDPAVAEYAAALGIDPGLAGAHYDWGNALLRAGRPFEAAAEYRAALRIRPGYATAENNLGLALHRLGQVDAAMTHYQTALRLDPNLPEARLNLGNALFGLGRLDQAVEQFHEALRLDPHSAAAHHNLAAALAELGRTAEARSELAAAERDGARP